jgi:hypothetical protein
VIVIDGDTFNVPILQLTDTLNFLDKYAERTVDGNLRRELIGTFPKARLIFASPTTWEERAEFGRLTSKLREPVEFHTVTIPAEDGTTFTFIAYVSEVTRELKRWTPAATWWKALSVTFTAQGPKDRP